MIRKAFILIFFFYTGTSSFSQNIEPKEKVNEIDLILDELFEEDEDENLKEEKKKRSRGDDLM